MSTAQNPSVAGSPSPPSGMSPRNLRLLAERLREPSTAARFDMRTWLTLQNSRLPLGEAIHTCGTVACIAGHAVALAHPEQTRWDLGSIAEAAQAWLGLTEDEADALFCAHDCNLTFDEITPVLAAAVVENAAETGRIDWSVAEASTSSEPATTLADPQDEP